MSSYKFATITSVSPNFETPQHFTKTPSCSSGIFLLSSFV